MRRTLTNLAAVAILAVKSPLARLGLIRRTCAWRRATGIGLRSQSSKFCLAAFGLDLWSDCDTPPDRPARADIEKHFIHRWGAFLADEPCAHWRVEERRGCCYSVAVPRPPGVRRGDAESHGRDESVCAVWFEHVTGVAFDELRRFEPPEFMSLETARPELLNVVCRVSPDGRTADVWMLIHHAVADGAPMQEMLTRLERSWGLREAVVYPRPEQWRPRSMPRPWYRRGERPLGQLLDFVDFTPLLSARRKISAEPPPTIAALLIWHVARQPGFEDKRFASTVDVPAGGAEPRCVDFVVIRPADYADLPTFSKEFDRQVEACRTRLSQTRAAIRAISLLPPRLAMAALTLNPERTNATFGTVGLTILRDAKVFLAPMTDTGFDDGFVAIGGMSLPTADDRRVGAVSVKGTSGKSEAVLIALRNAVAQMSTF